METKIEIKNLCPMIAMISAGKTSILNVIFDIDFLEANAGIGTKFVNIIRYNPEVGKVPIFYHLNVKNVGNGNYEFYKDPKTLIVGKENIKKKNIEINNILKEKKEKNDKYEDLFYMIEIGEVNFIKDKEYLKNYDLVDIPGVSEYRPPETQVPKEDVTKNENSLENLDQDAALLANLADPQPIEEKEEKEDEPNSKKETDNLLQRSNTVESQMLSYNPDKEQNYLTEIFKILKNKINNGIIVFNIENFQLEENYLIIGKLQKILNKPIENFLVLLNKVDKSENVERDKKILDQKLIEYFPNQEFNMNKNTIVTCSALQLENEVKMNNSFFHLIYYFFLNFLIKVKNENFSSITPTSGSYSFIDFLIKFIPNKKNMKKKNFSKKINNVLEDKDFKNILKEITESIDIIIKNHKGDNVNFEIRRDDFDKSEIEIIKENLKNAQEEENKDDNDENEDEDDFNIEKQDGNVIFLYYYSEFKYSKNKKIIPPISTETKEIINYFTMKNMEKDYNKEIKDIEKQINNKENKDKSLNEKIDNISERIKIFYKEYEEAKIKEEKLPNLRQCINSSIGILKTSKLLYIPILGVSNAGKSTILNGLIGDRILPTKQDECTKKGILIKYTDIDIPVIRKTKFVYENLGKDKVYYFEPFKNIIGKGIDQINRVLEGANGKFINNEEDFFYEIDIRIQIIHKDKQMDKNLKEKICFIDLPGFGTGNNFENKGTYAHLMKSCNIFLFVVRNLKIKENDNHKMLFNLYENMSKFRKLAKPAFLNKCIFIINCDSKQEITPKTKNQAINDIKETLQLEKSDSKEVNLCFYNAKYYENYVFKLKYYINPEFIFRYEMKEFENSVNNYYKGNAQKDIDSSFNKYFINILKSNISSDIINPKFAEKTANIDKDTDEIVKILFKENQLSFSQKDLELIIKYISFGKENIKNSSLLAESNISEFKNELKINIEKCKKIEEKEINENLKWCFNILDHLLEIDPAIKIGNLRDAPKIEIIEPKAEEDLITFEKNIDILVLAIQNDFFNNNVMKVLSNCQEELKTSLEEQKKNISESLKKENWSKIQKSFEDTYKEKTNNLKEELLKTVENCSTNVHDNYLKCYELINKFYANNQTPQELLFKNFLSEKLGRENNIELTIDDIINDILASARNVTKWKERKSFWDGIKTKFNDKHFLNKIIDVLINNSTSKIKEFIGTTSGHVEEFKTKIINEINTKKETVRYILNEKKEKEQMEIKEKEKKNEEEKKKWEEEKRQYEEKKRKWEETCQKYKELRYEIALLRLFEN